MKTVQIDQLTTLKRFKIVCDKQTTAGLTTGIDGWTDEFAILTGSIANADAAGGVQEKDIKGLAKSSTAAKRAVVLKLLKFASRAAYKARKAGNQKLAEQLGHKYSYYFRADRTTCMQRVKDSRDALNDNLLLFTNVTAPDIAAIDALVTAFADIEDLPDTEKIAKKAEGTDVLPGILKAGMEAMDNLNSLFYSYNNDDHPEAVDEMELATHIVKTGVHHTGIIAFFVAALKNQDGSSNALENMQMKIIELNLIATSDINGLAGMAKIKAGTYHIEFSGSGYVTQTLIIAIKRGHMTEIEVDMVKA